MTATKKPESQQGRNLGCERSHTGENECEWVVMCVIGCRCTSTHQNKVIKGKMGKQGCGKWIGMPYTTQKRRKQSSMVAVVREDHGGNDRGERGYLWIIGIHIRKVITHMHAPPPKKGKTNSCTCWCNQVQNKQKNLPK